MIATRTGRSIVVQLGRARRHRHGSRLRDRRGPRLGSWPAAGSTSRSSAGAGSGSTTWRPTIAEAGGRAFPVPADLAQRRGAPARSSTRVLARARARRRDRQQRSELPAARPFDEFTLEEFDDHLAVNVRAPYFLVQAALPALRASPAAVVVNVSSAAAAMYRRGQTLYGLTKAALEHMTMNMAAELAPDRIRVVCVRPGPVATEIHTAVADPEARLRELAKLVPLGRVGQPDEIARWIGHLVDPEADWVTGHRAHDRRRPHPRPARSLSVRDQPVSRRVDGRSHAGSGRPGTARTPRAAPGRRSSPAIASPAGGDTRHAEHRVARREVGVPVRLRPVEDRQPVDRHRPEPGPGSS